MCKAVVILPSVIDTSRLDENFGENVTSNLLLAGSSVSVAVGQWRWPVEMGCATGV